jgi:hypothetical protein
VRSEEEQRLALGMHGERLLHAVHLAYEREYLLVRTEPYPGTSQSILPAAAIASRRTRASVYPACRRFARSLRR